MIILRDKGNILLEYNRKCHFSRYILSIIATVFPSTGCVVKYSVFNLIEGACFQVDDQGL